MHISLSLLLELDSSASNWKVPKTNSSGHHLPFSACFLLTIIPFGREKKHGFKMLIGHQMRRIKNPTVVGWGKRDWHSRPVSSCVCVRSGEIPASEKKEGQDFIIHGKLFPRAPGNWQNQKPLIWWTWKVAQCQLSPNVELSAIQRRWNSSYWIEEASKETEKVAPSMSSIKKKITALWTSRPSVAQSMEKCLQIYRTAKSRKLILLFHKGLWLVKWKQDKTGIQKCQLPNLVQRASLV